MNVMNPYVAGHQLDPLLHASSELSVFTSEKLSQLDAIRQSKVKVSDREVILLTPVITDFKTISQQYLP